jgi:hypothetical protein
VLRSLPKSRIQADSRVRLGRQALNLPGAQIGDPPEDAIHSQGAPAAPTSTTWWRVESAWEHPPLPAIIICLDAGEERTDAQMGGARTESWRERPPYCFAKNFSITSSELIFCCGSSSIKVSERRNYSLGTSWRLLRNASASGIVRGDDSGNSGVSNANVTYWNALSRSTRRILTYVWP